ncbi:CIC_collapsed_G0048010.mRNA.1.CDS.1 [Saccharomyces cerevisiae]|nr:CIC_collapsed_G0048010.mRNA.1.CDS.1 [Saccharomyces cerevisiae]
MSTSFSGVQGLLQQGWPRLVSTSLICNPPSLLPENGSSEGLSTVTHRVRTRKHQTSYGNHLDL